MLKDLKKDVIICMLFLLIGGLFCVYLKQEIWIDLFNYHYHNGWALLSGKTFENFAPSGARSYFNPLLDVWTYFIISNFNNFPAFVCFLQGLWFGLLLFIIYKWALLLIPHKTKLDKLCCVAALLFACCGYAVIRQVGTSSGEVQIAVIFLSAFYLIYKNIFPTDNKSISVKQIVIGAFLAGLCLGLKPTVFPSAVALGITLLLFAKKLNNPIKMLIYMFFASLFGYLIANGWWMILVYNYTGNPFFPFFNNIFHNPLLADDMLRDARFLPKNIMEYFIYPLTWLWHSNMYVTDIPVIIVQFPIIFTVVITLGLCCLLGFTIGKNTKFLIVLWLIAYLIWLVSFSILRYAIPLEIIGAILCLWLVSRIKDRLFKIAGILFFVFISLCSPYLCYDNWNSFYSSEKYLPKIDLKISDDTTLILYSLRLSFLVPNIESKNPIVSHIYDKTDWGIFASDEFYKNIIKKHSNKVALMFMGVNNKPYDVNNIRCTLMLKEIPVFICPPLKNGVVEGYPLEKVFR